MHSDTHERDRNWSHLDHPGRRFGRHFGPGRADGRRGPDGPDGPDDAEEFDGFGRRGRGRGRGRMQRGDIRTAILAVLVEGPGHGYDIMSRLEEKSGGAWRPSAGSVYPTLQQLEDEDLVTSTEADGKRVFTITEVGSTEAQRRLDEAGGEPWANRRGRAHAGQLFRSIQGLNLAAKQVVVAGSGAQLTASIAIVDRARQEIYRLLADGGSEGTDDPGEAETPEAEPV